MQQSQHNNSQHKSADVVYHPTDNQDYKWVRSSNGVFAGVCEGLARSLNIPTWAMRLLWIILTFAAFGTGLIIYLILAFCLPDEHSIPKSEQSKFMGVCLRLSRAFNIEVGVIRALTVFLALASLGVTIVGYIILHFVVPERPQPLF